ncbi:MAG: phospholipase D-like domain-containing protein [Firmicutes bacterium]|nr:phospholipase D-like domain-containing protein [Bacillota bacterium]
MSPTRDIGEGFLTVIAIVLLLQIIVVASSAISTRFRRRRTLSIDHLPPKATRIGENELMIYTYGQDLYRDMLRDISLATSSICVESFIWKGDRTGEAFKEVLAQKAREGVDVYVIYDAFANLVVPRAFKQFPKEIHVYPYRAWRKIWYIFDPRRWARDHRKLMVIDRQTAYVGGYNIGELYGLKWRDTHLRVEGNVALNLYASFIDFWTDHADEALTLKKVTASLHPNIRLYANNPTRLMFPIRSMYIEAIDLAKERVWLTTPYFVPDRFVLASLVRAAKRGVDVHLIIPEQSNHLLADWLARTYFTSCMQEGIHIHLYQGAMIHAKTAIIDGTWTTIGTANLDRLSLLGNHELNIEIFDDGMAALMESVFLSDRQNCRTLALAEWVRRPMAQKLGELVLSPLWPFL